MGGPGSGPRPGKGHNAKNFPKRRMAQEMSGGKFKNLKKAFEYARTPEGTRVAKNVRIMKRIMMNHTFKAAKASHAKTLKMLEEFRKEKK